MTDNCEALVSGIGKDKPFVSIFDPDMAVLIVGGRKRFTDFKKLVLFNTSPIVKNVESQ